MIPVNVLTAAWSVLAPLAQKTPDPNDVKPGWLGFVVIVGLGAAVVFLLFSFRKQLRKVRVEPGDDGGRSGAGNGTEAHNGSPADGGSGPRA
jgi:hypothetical protein